MENIELGKRIKHFRINKGLTQKDLADALFITQKSVSRWENGFNMPSDEMLRNLAKVLDVSFIDLKEPGKNNTDLKLFRIFFITNCTISLLVSIVSLVLLLTMNYFASFLTSSISFSLLMLAAYIFLFFFRNIIKDKFLFIPQRYMELSFYISQIISLIITVVSLSIFLLNTGNEFLVFSHSITSLVTGLGLIFLISIGFKQKIIITDVISKASLTFSFIFAFSCSLFLNVTNTETNLSQYAILLIIDSNITSYVYRIIGLFLWSLGLSLLVFFTYKRKILLSMITYLLIVTGVVFCTIDHILTSGYIININIFPTVVLLLSAIFMIIILIRNHLIRKSHPFISNN